MIEVRFGEPGPGRNTILRTGNVDIDYRFKPNTTVENEIYILKQLRKVYEDFTEDDDYAKIIVQQIDERLKELGV